MSMSKGPYTTWYDKVPGKTVKWKEKDWKKAGYRHVPNGVVRRGSFLLKEALKMIDEKGDRAYLEASNESNKALYERHGFVEIGRVQFEDSPPAFPMIREPGK